MARRKKAWTLEEAAATVAGAKTLSVPNSWLTKLPATRQSVFESLYDWLKEEHSVTEDLRRDLHNRTFAGKDLMKRLLAAETKRIRKLHNLTGEKLRRAVGFSDMNGGPQGLFEWHLLKGDGLLVLPPTKD